MQVCYVFDELKSFTLALQYGYGVPNFFSEICTNISWRDDKRSSCAKLNMKPIGKRNEYWEEQQNCHKYVYNMAIYIISYRYH